MMVLFSA